MVFAYVIGETRPTVTFKLDKVAHSLAWRCKGSTSCDNIIFASELVKHEFEAMFWPKALFRIHAPSHIAKFVGRCILKKIDVRHTRVGQYNDGELSMLKELPRVNWGTNGSQYQIVVIGKLFEKWAHVRDVDAPLQPTNTRVLKIYLADLNDHGSCSNHPRAVFSATCSLMEQHNLAADKLSTDLQRSQHGFPEGEKWQLIVEKSDIAAVTSMLQWATFCPCHRMWKFENGTSLDEVELRQLP